MNKYETVFIANPNLEEEGIKALIEKFSELINKSGKVEKVDEVGKKKLAYEIKKNTEDAILGVVEATNNLFTSNILNLFVIQSIGIIIYSIFA